MRDFTVVTTMKNEGAFLLEWVAHHKALGFDHLVICTNDCADGTDAMMLRLQELGLARHHATRVWPAAGIQRSALKQARRLAEVRDAAWIWICDADEFLVVKQGDGSVRALAEGAGLAEAVTVPWRIFGPRGECAYQDQPVTRRFRHAEAEPDDRPVLGTYGKTLFRGDLPMPLRYGAHGPVPRPELGRDYRRVFPGGRPLVRAGSRLQIARDYRLAQVNHYALRDFDSFLVKRARGRVNHGADTMGLDYWRRFDLADTPCDAIRRYDDAVAGWTARLMADAALADLHRGAVGWHRATAARLADLPENRRLRAALQDEGRLTP